MRARDVMSVGVVSVDADAALLEAAELLLNFKISALPVVEWTGPLAEPRHGALVGILSDADLMGEVLSGADKTARGTRKVRDFMTSDVVTAEEDTPLYQIVDLMKRGNIKRVPIVRDGVLTGIVSRIDILRGMVAVAHGLGHEEDLLPPAARDDEALRHEIHAVCRGRRWSTARQMDVVVHDGIAHLWGVAPSDLVRHAYRAAAVNVPGVKRVEMHMHVVPTVLSARCQT